MQIDFSEEFSASLYRSVNNDLMFFSDENLVKHYKNFGMNEGRVCNEVTDRKKLLKNIPNYMKCLEIGPFDSPVLNISSFNVKYFDVLDKEGLKLRAVQHNRNYNSVPEIDFVNNDGSLNVVNEKFDVVLSCHCIEHQIDFIKHLKDVSCLLNNTGVYVVILPDKRYCFDHFIKETTIADVINTHKLGTSVNHTLKSVIEHRALTCHNDTFRHWNNDHGSLDVKSESVRKAIKEYEEGIKHNKYIDVHSLQFTPTSFRNIIDLLYELEYIDFKIKRVYPTIKNSNEFFVILEKNQY
jgi:hypothetical protein